MEQTLRRGLSALGLPQEGVAALTDYARQMLEKNKVMNLTAITEPRDVAALHLLDSAALLTLADFRGKTVVDVGTGAGLPGLPLRLVDPSIRLTLLDAQRKRVAFLQAVCREWAPDVQCLHARAETLARQRREEFDIAVSRAVAQMGTLWELCLPLVRPGGWCLAMKSVHCDEELSASCRAISLLGGGTPLVREYCIPGTQVRRRLVLVPKERPTPPDYPRPFSKIKKGPI